jgi:maltodextrin utilization protein YvdJ
MFVISFTKDKRLFSFRIFNECNKLVTNSLKFNDTTYCLFVRFQVLTAVSMKFRVFWD